MAKYDYLKNIKSAGVTTAPIASAVTTAPTTVGKYDYLKDLKSTPALAPVPEKIFSGGKVMDLIDVLTIPQYMLTGALSSDYTVKEAIDQMISPKDILGLDGVAGFVVDVLTDPLSYVGVGVLTKAGKGLAKLGKGAKTLGGAAVKGERALVGASIPFTDITIPLIKGEKIMKGLTKAGEAFKSLPVGAKNVGKVLEETFGLLPATGKATITGIEEVAKRNSELRAMTKQFTRTKRVIDALNIEKILPVKKSLDKLLKDGVVTSADVLKFADNARLLASGATKGFNKLPTALAKVFDDFTPIITEAKTVITEVLPEELAQKGFTNIPLAAKKASTDVSVGGKILGSKEALEKFAEFSKVGGSVARTTKTAGELIETGAKIENVAGKWFDVDTATKIKALNKREDFLKMEIRELKKDGASIDRVGAAQTKLDSLQVNRQALQTKGMDRTGASSVEVNTALKKIGQEPVFKEDVFEEAFATLSGAQKVRSRTEVINAIKDNPKLVTPYEGKIVPKGLVKVNIPELKGYAAAPDVAQALEKTYFSYSKLGPVQDYLRIWNNAQNKLKGVLTYVNPAFHSRNAISNIWLALQGGLRSPASIVKGYKIMKDVGKFRGKGLTGDKLYKALGKDGKILKEFIDEGLGGTGAFGGDIERTLKGQNWAFELGGDVGNYIEDSGKMALFDDLRKQGFTKEAAGMEVRKFLFDYGDLTDVERVLFKTAIPFYAWMRNNIPMQLAMLIQKPGTVSVVGKAKTAIESMVEGEPMNEELLPEWMREGFNIYLGENPEGLKNYMALKGWLPTIDIASVTKPFSTIVEGITPMFKTPVELVLNYDFFYGKPIQEFEGERRTVFGLDIPGLSTPQGRKILDLVRPIKDIERLLGLSEWGSPADLPARLARFVGGLNVKGYDEQKQIDILDYLSDKEISKAKSAMKKAEERGDDGMAQELQGLIDKLEAGIIKPKL